MKPKPASKAKLFAGIMYSDKKTYSEVIKALEKKFGMPESVSEPYDFTAFTKYYASEMGKKILKRFVVFKALINRDELADIKLFTNKLEEKFSRKGRRKINIDPGYVTLHNLVLASAKERANKIYLGKGIYADLILIFHKNKCEHFSHTFPDFKSKLVQDFFLQVKKQLNSSNTAQIS